MKFDFAAAVLLATFQVAFAVSAMPSDHRERGFDDFEKGNCGGAVSELLAAHAEGDSSNILLLRLGQALECDNRIVDALSATYAGNKADTVGRIELLFYRAQLLRRIGLGEEAAKVEREAGQDLLQDFAGDGLDKTSGWAVGWGFAGGAGWRYEDNAQKSADSLGIYDSWINSNTGSITREPSRSSVIIDSVTIAGAQLPCFSSFSVDLVAPDWNASLAFSQQITLATDLADWLGANAGVDLSGSYQFINWIGVDAVAGLSRNWMPISGMDPYHQDQYSGSFAIWLKGQGLSLTATTVANFTDDPDGAEVFRTSQSVQLGIDLPQKIKLDLAAAFGQSDDRSEAYSYSLPAWILPVRNSYAHQPLLETTVIDSLGEPIGRLDLRKLLTEVPLRWAGRVDSSYSIPYSSRQDWSRWSGSLGLSHSPWTNFMWAVGLELARTELDHMQEGVLVEPLESWSAAVQAVRVFRDSVTGIDYVSYPGTSASLVPLKWARRRVDIAVTYRLGLRFRASRHVALRAGWAYTENESNLKHISDFASYTRTVWNVSASVGW